MSNKPTFIFSLFRIFAIYMVFCHHYLKNIGIIKNYTITVVVALGIFTFISGYLSNINSKPPKVWIKDQLIKIYIPYFLTIVPLILFCVLTGYKKVTLVKMLFELFAGAIFIKEAVLEQGWYITFIIGLYFITFLTKKKIVFNQHITLAIMSFSYFIFLSFTAGPEYITKNRLMVWIFCYALGFLAVQKKHWIDSIDRMILCRFNISDAVNFYFYRFSCYVLFFYLVHPIPINLFNNILNFNAESNIILSILAALILSFFLSQLSLFVRVRSRLI